MGMSEMKDDNVIVSVRLDCIQKLIQVMIMKPKGCVTLLSIIFLSETKYNVLAPNVIKWKLGHSMRF